MQQQPVMHHQSAVGVAAAEAPRPEAAAGGGTGSCLRGPGFYVSPAERAREERIVRAFRAGKRWEKPERVAPPFWMRDPMAALSPEEALAMVARLRARGFKIHPRRYLHFITYGAE